MKKFKKFLSLLLVAGILTVSMAAPASAATDLADKVTSKLGITALVTASNPVTRGQFAQILLNASEYKGSASSVVTYTLFSDVPTDYSFAAAVNMAAQKGWMSGYLDGSFKPDQAVTLKEAMYGTIALLGYTSSDFTGDQLQGRTSLFYSKKLDKDLNLSMDSTLSISDCTQLIYNLLKTDTKQGSMYGKLFDCTLSSDGEINYTSLLTADTNTITGPVLLDQNLEKAIPFKPERGSVFLDGVAVTADEVPEDCVIYYSTKTKTVWAYEEFLASGAVTGIGYDVSGSMTPTALYVDGEKYVVNTDEMRLALSSGKVKVGDDVTVIYEEAASSGEETICNLVGYLINKD